MLRAEWCLVTAEMGRHCKFEAPLRVCVLGLSLVVGAELSTRDYPGIIPPVTYVNRNPHKPFETGQIKFYSRPGDGACFVCKNSSVCTPVVGLLPGLQVL